MVTTPAHTIGAAYLPLAISLLKDSSDCLFWLGSGAFTLGGSTVRAALGSVEFVRVGCSHSNGPI